jgi:hypothetical protein
VEGDADAWVALEGVDHREVGAVVGLGDYPPEIADGLMVVEGQRQRDPASHAISSWKAAEGAAIRTQVVANIVAAGH